MTNHQRYECVGDPTGTLPEGTQVVSLGGNRFAYWLPDGIDTPTSAEINVAATARERSLKEIASLEVWYAEADVFEDPVSGLRVSTSRRAEVREAVTDIRAMVDASSVDAIDETTRFPAGDAIDDAPDELTLNVIEAEEFYGRLVAYGLSVRREYRRRMSALATRSESTA